MRIVSGTLGGRALRAPRGDRTRPTADKIRQAIFNILASLPGGGDLGGPFTGGAVLDLYAGSGALGLEALSRGAARAVFVDRGPEALRCLGENARALGVTAHVEIVRGEVARVLPRLTGPFSLVFVDPPYERGVSGEADRALAGLAATLGLLAPGALVVVEHDRRGPPADDPGTHSPLALLDRRRYGDTEVSFYR